MLAIFFNLSVKKGRPEKGNEFVLLIAFVFSVSISGISPPGGSTPYIRMIGMTVVFFSGWNRRFGIF